MKNTYALLQLTVFLLVARVGQAQSVGIGTTSPNSSAQLDISSTSRGLLIPRMSTTAISAIGSPAKGLMVYDTTQNQLVVNMGTAAAPDWENVVAKSGWSLTGNGGTGGSAVLGPTDVEPLTFISANLVVGSLDANSNNIGFGYGALNNGGCIQCIAIGVGAQETGAGGSIAIGSRAMASNTGSDNIGIGAEAVENSTGPDNVGVGNGALLGNISGQNNTAVGNGALQNTSNSWYNTVVGANSALAYDNGYNNVFVGANNDVTGPGYFNVIAIGQAVTCTASSQARIGNSATNSIGGYADWTNFSDGRYKKNMQEDVKGLDFIMRLRPITYHLDVTGIQAHLGQREVKDEGTRRSIAEREAEVLSGFAAQEVEAAAAASGYDFSGVDKPKNDKDFYGLRYGDFVVPLVKAVQEQQKMIEALQREVAELKKQIQH
jgi:hypothetical protein